MAARMNSAFGTRAGRAMAGLVLAGAAAVAAAQSAQQPAPAPSAQPAPPAQAAQEKPAPPPTRAPAPAWDAAKSAAAQPVWPVSAVPAAVTALPAERLGALQLGMATDAVQGALGAPHSNLKADGGVGEVWQYVVSERAANRAYIVSLWFDRKGLWMASGQSRPVGQLSDVAFGAAPTVAGVPAPVVSAPPAQVAPAAPAPPPAAPAPPPVAPAPAVAAPAPPVAAAPAAPPPAAETAQPLVVYPAAKGAAPSVLAAAAAPAAPITAPAAVDETALKQLLERWLADWNRRDATAYMTHYAPDYSLAGKPRAQWESERRQRMEGTRFIRVSAENVEVRKADSARPQLAFIQNYESDRYKERSRKVLTLMQVDGRWMIVREENTTLPR